MDLPGNIRIAVQLAAGAVIVLNVIRDWGHGASWWRVAQVFVASLALGLMVPWGAWERAAVQSLPLAVAMAALVRGGGPPRKEPEWLAFLLTPAQQRSRRRARLSADLLVAEGILVAIGWTATLLLVLPREDVVRPAALVPLSLTLFVYWRSSRAWGRARRSAERAAQRWPALRLPTSR